METSLGNIAKTRLYKKKKKLAGPGDVVPATWEAGESLEPGRWELQ